LLLKIHALRSIALSVAFIFALNLAAPALSFAAGFFDHATDGKSLGDFLVGMHTPATVDPNDVIPNYSDVQEQSGSFREYYTNPAGMAANADGEALGFVRDSYTSRRQFDLSDDPTFGNKCLARDEEGKCTQWSLSGDLYTNTYPDCTKVFIPKYEKSTLKTCSNTVTYPITPECAIRKYLDSSVEETEGPCSSKEDLGVLDAQIYAVCKDNRDLYRVPQGTIMNAPSDWAMVDPLLCAQIPGGCDCHMDCPVKTLVAPTEGDLPEGAQYLYQGYLLDWCVGDSGERVCQATVYKYYLHEKLSTLERLYIRKDRTCSEERLDEWMNGDKCIIWDYAKCDSAGIVCTYLIKDGVETGETAQEECQSYPSTLYGNKPVMYDPDGYDACVAGCPLVYTGDTCTDTNPAHQYEDCSSGECIMTSPTCTNCSLCSSCAGICSDCTDCYGCTPGSTNPGGPYMQCAGGGVLKDPVCKAACRAAATIILDNYEVCLPDDGLDGTTVNGKIVTPNPSTLIRFTTKESTLILSWLAQLGGPGVENSANNWYTKVRFKCREENNTCNELIEEGCVLYQKKCINPPDCTQYEYTYKCGEDRLIGYEVVYNCAGELRCMGTECGAVTDFTANKELGAALAAGEILNMARVDSYKTGDGIEIFPGKAMECQSGPENCCKPDTGGMSIADYISAAKMAYDIYNFASVGFSFSAYAAGYAATVVNIGNTVGSWVGLASATTVTMEAGGIATTTTTITSVLGTSTATTTMAGASSTVSATIAAPTALISALGTIMCGIGIIMMVYTICTMICDSMFACTDEDFETSMKLGFNLCHYVGTRTESKLGFFTQRWEQYCCFSSILARVIHEQGRPQIGLAWGGMQSEPNCRGFTTQELSSLDFSKMDLSEYLRYVKHKTEVNEEDIERIRQKFQDYVPPSQ
jgi:hypothetical protein